MFQKVKTFFNIVSPELLIWTGGLLMLAFLPFGTDHYTICPFSNLGIPYCPGCGLGESLHNLFHLDIAGSFYSHPLGILALLIILSRIITLSKISITNYSFSKKRNYNG
jgi:hypothetical protein